MRRLDLSTKAIGWLLIAWAFFFALAGPGANIQTVLMVIGTIVYLLV